MNEWFGLGIMLECRDRMSEGLRTAQNSFEQFRSSLASGVEDARSQIDQLNNLAVTGIQMQIGGGILSGFGEAMLSPVVQLGQEVVSTSSQFEEWRMTLKALYKDQEVATQKASEAMQLAAKTPFEVGDVVQAVIGFKAIGAEALQVMENIEGVNNQGRTFLEYMGDLASLRPDVGLNGVLLGVRNLLGGDGGKSLRMRMDMDFESMLGEEWGSTTEEIMSQLVRVSDKVAGGLMKELEGTWNQIISNLKDQSTRLYLAIGDNGAFNMFKKSLQGIADIISSIDDDKMARIGQNIAEAFSMIWKPVQFLIDGFAVLLKGIINLASSDSVFAKIGLGVLAFGGTILAVTGALLTFGGGLITTLASLGTFLLTMASAGGFTATFGAMLGVLKTRLLSLGMTLLPFLGLFVAYKTNFLGLKTTVDNFTNTIKTAFTESGRIASLGVTDMLNEISKLDKTKFGDNLILRLVKVRVFFDALCDAWNDNELSDENFRKVSELGLLPLLTTILDIKARFESFWTGFKRGWENIANVVSTVVTTVGEWIGKLIDFLFPVEEVTSDINDVVGGINTKGWEKFGEVVAYVAGFVGSLWAITKIAGIISTVWGWITGVGGLVMSVIGGIGKLVGVIGTAFTWVGTLVTAILGFFGIVATLPAWLVGLITVAVGAIIGLVIAFWDEIVAGIKWACERISEWWSNVCEDFQQLCTDISTWWDDVCREFSQAWDNFCSDVKTWWADVCDKFNQDVEAIKLWWSNLCTDISNWWTNLCDSVVNWWTTMCDNIQNWWTNLCNNVVTWWTDLCNNIQEWWNGVVSFISEKLSAIGKFFSDVWDSILELVSTVFNDISTKASEIYNGITQVWSNVTGFFSDIWSGIKEGAVEMFNWLGEKFGWIADTISGIKEAMSNIGSGISNAASTVWNGAKKLVGLNTGGYVKTEGVAMLHPNEVVVNDDLTQKLRAFLNTQEAPSLTNVREQEDKPQLATRSLEGRQLSNNSPSAVNNSTSNDNSITFSEGAIQINIEKATEQDANKLAKMIMEKIKKETQLRSTLNYRPI